MGFGAPGSCSDSRHTEEARPLGVKSQASEEGGIRRRGLLLRKSRGCGGGRAEKNDGITTLPLRPSRDHRDEGALTALGLSSVCEVPGV